MTSPGSWHAFTTAFMAWLATRPRPTVHVR